MINYKFFFESKRKKNRGNGLKIDLFITWHGREPREEQSWLVSRVQATALNESDALPPASVCRGIFLRPKRSSSWTAVSRGHYNWESYEKKENWKIFPISNFVINDKLSDWDRFLDFISFRKISPPPPILKKLECWRLIRTTTSATSFHTRRSIHFCAVWYSWYTQEEPCNAKGKACRLFPLMLLSGLSSWHFEEETRGYKRREMRRKI